MFWFLTKKELKKEFTKIRTAFRKSKVVADENSKEIKEIKNNLVSKKEVDLMIREQMVKLREVTPRTTRSKPRSKIRKVADRKLDRAEIKHEIAILLEKGYSTSEIRKQIVDIKQLCKPTCFFKYLKLLRGVTNELREPTPRSSAK